MSDLLNSASLVMVPSGYKEDTVYSVVPSDGSGDMAFTRASNGTRINSAGLVEGVPWNLVEQSNTFNTTWLKNNVTLTSGQTDKDGNANAWKVEFTGGANDSYLFQQLPVGQKTGAVWVKGTVGQTAYIGLRSSVASGDLITFTGNWQQILETTTDVYFVFSNYGAGTATTFFIQNAQANIGTSLKPYFPTTDRLNVPRLTYQNGGGGCPSLLLEKQSTNLQLYSEDFRNIAEGGATNTWTPNDTIILSTNNTAPDGTLSATRIRGNGSNRARQAVIFGTSGAPYSGSIFIRRVSGTANIELRVGDVSQVSTINPTSDWQRFTHTASPTSTAIRLAVVFSNNTDEFEIWGAQLEASSYATSYIGPTTSSSATRVADLATKSSISSLFGASATSLFMDFEITQVSSGGNWTVTGYDGSNLFSLCQFDNASNFPRIVFDGGVDTTLGTALSIGRHKIAVSFATNDFRAYIDGVLVHTDTSCTYNRYDRIAVNGTAWTGNTNNTNSFKLNEYAQFPNVLTNAELASLTTI